MILTYLRPNFFSIGISMGRAKIKLFDVLALCRFDVLVDVRASTPPLHVKLWARALWF